MPPEAAGERFLELSEHGRGGELGERLERFRSLRIPETGSD